MREIEAVGADGVAARARRGHTPDTGVSDVTQCGVTSKGVCRCQGLGQFDQQVAVVNQFECRQ